MKTKIALSFLALALASACSAVPTIDNSFPPQVVWNDTATHEGVTYPATDLPGD